MSTALDCSRNYVRGACLCHIHWFPLGIPCYQSGLLLKKSLPSFEVLNLADSCLDDENEIPLTVIAWLSAGRFSLPSIPLIVLHSLVRYVFWSNVLDKISQFFPFMLIDAFLDVFIQSWQFRGGGVSFAGVVSSGHHVHYFC